VTVQWQDSPDDHGNSVTGFSLSFLESDQITYSQILSHCDPSDVSVTDFAKVCTIPMQVFIDSPYSYNINTPIIGTVKATNQRGESDASTPNTAGALAQD
jgi:hypothetical protein